jgi:beta-galactosidase/beta-glucuronidase
MCCQCCVLCERVVALQVPATYIKSLVINQASMTKVVIQTNLAGGTAAGTVSYNVKDSTGASVATGSGAAGANVSIEIVNAHLWSTTAPNLYDVEITAGADSVRRCQTIYPCLYFQTCRFFCFFGRG